MYYEIYIDVVFMANFLMDYMLLRLVGTIFRCRRSRKRAFFAAALGAFFSCFPVYFQTDTFLPAYILLHGGCAFGMVMLGCGLKKGSLLLKAVVTLYLAAFLCGGFLEAVQAEKRMTAGLFCLLAAGMYLGLLAISYLSDSLRSRMRNVYPITLSFQGKAQECSGFYDSGNQLTDTGGGAPVSIVKPEILGELLPKETAEALKNLKENPGELKSTELAGLKPHFLPCRTIDGNGLLLAVTLEKLMIQTPSRVIRVNSPVLALTNDPSALSKEYEVLLNFRLLQQEGEQL